jgi:hypothetical protein
MLAYEGFDARGVTCLVGLFLIPLVTGLMLWAPAIRLRWLRLLVRIVGGSAAAFVLPVVFFVAVLSLGDPKPQYRTTTSPHGLHQATLMYQAGFLGRDVSSIKITKKGCCKRFIAYEYAGPSDLASTTMSWLDDSHLQIQYYTDHDRYQQCDTRVADVTIICIPLIRTN